MIVTIFGAPISIKMEYDFNSKEDASDFLNNEGFVYDEDENGISYWSKGNDIFATIETK